MTDDHRRHEESLAAYALGALEPAERAVVERHLPGCPACREQLAALAGLPGLLSRLTWEEAASTARGAPTASVDRAIARVAQVQRSDRRRLRRWQAVAVAAAVAAVLAILPLPAGVTELPPEPSAGSALTGSLRVIDREWGMAMELELRNVEADGGYTLVAVTDEGHRTSAGSWRGTESGTVSLTASCYVRRAQLDRVEVVDRDDRVLLTFPARAVETE